MCITMYRIVKCTLLLTVLVSVSHVTQAECGARFDLTLVIDSSGSIRENNPADKSYDNWNLTLSFLTRFVDTLDITNSLTEGVRVAGVTFSDKAQIEFFFHTNSVALKADIQDTAYQEGNTNTSAGIRLMSEEVFGEPDRTDFLGKQGTTDRPNIRNVALIITDGFSTYDNHRTVSDATVAKNEDVTIFVIGVTKKIKEDEIRQVSSMPQQENKTYWLLPDFQALEPVVQNIASEICFQVVNPATTPPALVTPAADVLVGTTAAYVDDAVLIGIGVLCALLLLLLLLFLILCCCCRTLPCCAGCCPAAGACAGCCHTEVFCCCGSMLCCWCCAQWMLCCCGCLCWSKHHHGRRAVSPSASDVVIIGKEPEYLTKSTQASLVSLKPAPVTPMTITREVCSKCRQELPKCTCKSVELPVGPVVRPYLLPQPLPGPVIQPINTPCALCYNQCNGSSCPYCTQHNHGTHSHAGHYHQCCGTQPACRDSHCEICDRNQHHHTQHTIDYRPHCSGDYAIQPRHSVRRNQVADYAHIYLKQHKSSSLKHHEQYESDGNNDVTDAYAKVLTRSQEREEKSRSKATGKMVSKGHGSLNEYGSHDSCSTRIFLVSDEQMSEKGSEKSYVYLPTECPVRMSSEMSDTLKNDFARVTAGK